MNSLLPSPLDMALITSSLPNDFFTSMVTGE